MRGNTNKLTSEEVKEITEIIAKCASDESGKVMIVNNGLVEQGAWVIGYKNTWYHVLQNHDLISDEITYQISLIYSLGVCGDNVVSIDNDGNMEYVIVEAEEAEDDESDSGF